MRRRWPILVIGLMVSLGLLWYSLQDLHLREVWAALNQANYWWLIPGVA
ncbi:MAG TPA: UPF0104 family protein, partial [Anaerolineae bacterium]|nr:UPF0104 family protein [Anaerolineae bacterium]